MDSSVLSYTYLRFVLLSATQGGAKALKECLDDPKSSGFLVRQYNTSGIAKKIHTCRHGCILEIEQTVTDEITASATATGDRLCVYRGKPPHNLEMSKILQSPTNFLPLILNSATFLLLNSARRFYITSQLSGCDVWVADHEDFEPLTIHTNKNSIKDPVENLKCKEDLAIDALKLFGTKTKLQYKFVLRISCNYKETHPDKGREIDEYWGRFQDQHNIPTSLYDPPALFYGVFSSGLFGRNPLWTFSLKDTRNGPKIRELVCRVNTK